MLLCIVYAMLFVDSVNIYRENFGVTPYVALCRECINCFDIYTIECIRNTYD